MLVADGDPFCWGDKTSQHHRDGSNGRRGGYTGGKDCRVASRKGPQAGNAATLLRRAHHASHDARMRRCSARRRRGRLPSGARSSAARPHAVPRSGAGSLARHGLSVGRGAHAPSYLPPPTRRPVPPRRKWTGHCPYWTGAPETPWRAWMRRSRSRTPLLAERTRNLRAPTARWPESAKI